MATCGYCDKEVSSGPCKFGLGTKEFCDSLCAWKFYELKFDRTGNISRKRRAAKT